jgi:hypothetical protein
LRSAVRQSQPPVLSFCHLSHPIQRHRPNPLHPNYPSRALCARFLARCGRLPPSRQTDATQSRSHPPLPNPSRLRPCWHHGSSAHAGGDAGDRRLLVVSTTFVTSPTSCCPNWPEEMATSEGDHRIASPHPPSSVPLPPSPLPTSRRPQPTRGNGGERGQT